jgi:hypothetical protein
MTLLRLITAAAIACAIATCPFTPAALHFIAPAFAQSVASAPGAADFSPVVTVGLSVASLAALIVGAWFIYGHVKDQNARTALLTILEKGVSLGFNVVEGALKDKVLNVNVGSSVAAQALKYVLQFAPDALAHFGLNDPAVVAKMIWARLPAVDGPVSDDTFHQIAAAATGKGAPASAADVAALVAQAAPALAEELTKLLRKPTAPPAPAQRA